VLGLGMAMALFAWISSASLQNRQADATRVIQKLAIKNLGRRLDQAFRSPSFVRDFLARNPALNSSAHDMLKQPGFKTVQESNLTLYDFDHKPWIGADTSRTALRLMLPDFARCPDSDPRENSCPVTSQIEATVSTQDGVGYVDLSIVLSSVELRLNAANPENKIHIRFPLNLMQVRIKERQIFCNEGSKAMLVSQAPGDFLCVAEN